MFDFRQIAGPEDSKQENFSTLCTCLLMRLHPEAKSVEGKGGDEGIDAYIGDFDGNPRIFQHKYFLETLKSTQKRQIAASLEQAVRCHDPVSWTLMLPKELTPAEQRWFESLRQKYPNVQLDWWGKTKLRELLATNPDLASAFQPAATLLMGFFREGRTIDETPVEKIVEDLLRQVSASGRAPKATDVLAAAAVDIKMRPRLRVLIWGPGEAAGELWTKRCEIRDRLKQLGHEAFFSEDLLDLGALRASGLNLTVEEYLQAKSCDYVVCLMSSPGSIGEVHDFAKDKKLAHKMMICIDAEHKTGYSARGALGIFEGYNGKLDWFDGAADLTECRLASRVLTQINNVANAKHWELATGGAIS